MGAEMFNICSTFREEDRSRRRIYSICSTYVEHCTTVAFLDIDFAP